MDTVLTKVEIPVVYLQDVVARASKGSTFIDVIPLSGYMEIKIKDGVLSARTTNNSYYLTTICKTKLNQPDFEAVVDTKLFSALVSKLKGDSVSLSVEDNNVKVQTKTGKYNIAYQVDLSTNTKVKFPEVSFEPNGATTHITCAEVRSILGLNKACKSNMKDIPALFNYYMDTEKVLTSNDSKACYNPIKVVDRPSALTPEVFELVPNVMDDDADISKSYGVDISENDDSIMFFSETGTLIGKKASVADLQAFPSEEFTSIFNSPMELSVTINRSTFLQVIDPMGLFTDPYEQNRIKLTFTQSGVTLYNEKTDSEEKMEFIPPLSQDIQPVVIEVNAMELKEELTASTAEQIKLSFDEGKLKLSLDNNLELLLSAVEVG